MIPYYDCCIEVPVCTYPRMGSEEHLTLATVAKLSS
jgi:hypothetical protein